MGHILGGRSSENNSFPCSDLLTCIHVGISAAWLIEQDLGISRDMSRSRGSLAPTTQGLTLQKQILWQSEGGWVHRRKGDKQAEQTLSRQGSRRQHLETDSYSKKARELSINCQDHKLDHKHKQHILVVFLVGAWLWSSAGVFKSSSAFKSRAWRLTLTLTATRIEATSLR